MKRTAADFLAEAKSDDPFELTVPGRKTPFKPKAYTQFTHDEQHRLSKAQLKWGKAVQSGEVLDISEDEQPFFVELRIRFGRDFEAFWKAASEWPKAAITKLITEVDEYYDPEPKDGSGDGAGEAKSPRLTSVGS